MFRLEFNPTSDAHCYANVIGDAESIWNLWFILDAAGISTRIVSIMMHTVVDPRKGSAAMLSNTLPWHQLSQ